jgi:hypothetical protein
VSDKEHEGWPNRDIAGDIDGEVFCMAGSLAEIVAYRRKSALFFSASSTVAARSGRIAFSAATVARITVSEASCVSGKSGPTPVSVALPTNPGRSR